MTIVFSGVQPTGDLHIGNYFGAMKSFVSTEIIEENSKSLFCVVDLHAMTLKHDPVALRQHTLDVTAAYLAIGLGHDSVIFAQSSVPQHTEMAWMLNCVARMGWMERMVQFKDKGGEDKERASVGLFTYPILMAADILTYGATHVPVGDDQKQHLVLARDIAAKFNRDFDGELTIPTAVHSNAPRIMSLIDGTKKMSKSDPNANSRINLTDSADIIVKKVRKATADTQPFPEDLTGDLKPEVRNLITIFKACTNATDEAVVREFGGKGYGTFKPALAEALVTEIEPIGKEMARLRGDPAELLKVLRGGAASASIYAEPTMAHVKERLGLLSF